MNAERTDRDRGRATSLRFRATIPPIHQPIDGACSQEHIALSISPSLTLTRRVAVGRLILGPHKHGRGRSWSRVGATAVPQCIRSENMMWPEFGATGIQIHSDMIYHGAEFTQQHQLELSEIVGELLWSACPSTPGTPARRPASLTAVSINTFGANG